MPQFKFMAPRCHINGTFETENACILHEMKEWCPK